ncbi:MAG: hypothetical protein GX596_05060 [Propionibacterium sp.]|nr:hypothetical protein [Propionibacterium sp.]
MASVRATLDRLLADRDDGRLAQLCAELGVDLLTHFGSSLRDPGNARDVDVAYSFRHGHHGDDLAVVNAFGERYGDALDLMPLDRAGSVARVHALSLGEVLAELTPQKFATMQMASYGIYLDEAPLRARVLQVMAE